MRRWVSLFTLLALTGCAVDESDSLEAAQTEASTLQPDDPSTVLRARIVWDSADSDSYSVKGEPFSHSARKWHVYLLTAYPGARIAARFHVDDARMHGRSEVRLFGPARGDGSWPAAHAARTDDQGDAVIEARDLAMGRWAIVVGPDKASSFLPRYPADIAAMHPASGGEAEYVYLSEQPDGWWAYGEHETWRILAPLPANAAAGDATPGATFHLETIAGKKVDYVLDGWSKSSWFVEDGGKDLYGTLGNMNMKTQVFDLDPPGEPEEKYRHLLVTSVGLGNDALANPLLLRVVPEELGGRALAVAPAADCSDGAVCNEVHYQDDGQLVPAEVLGPAMRSFKPTYYDPGESSTYEIEVSCLGGCLPKKPSQLAPTKFPVYFAHGFNSSKAVWASLLADHLDKIPGFASFRFAESVDPFRPIPDRAEQLRRNLQKVILEVEQTQGAPDGEPFVRVNVMAHSMGGLDSRYLVGHPRYNEDCAVSQCTDANGQPESCCPPLGPDGSATTWRERVASITTMSTPHCGSSFASWGLQLLKGNWINAAFKLVATKYFGMDQAGQTTLIGTFAALSNEYCTDFMQPKMPVPDPKRSYSWACATGMEGDCTKPTGVDAPAWSGNAWLLPGPKQGLPTVFSWAGVSCVTGSCGDIVDPGLMVPFLKVRAAEGDNDGVVAVSSARFGIFMGTLPHDHFDWNRTQGESSSEGFGNWLFGIRKEPAERFYLQWLGMLHDAGY
jgi:triacylglycerol esterase/lipase EstA (alpha/beta hydrolase family)